MAISEQNNPQPTPSSHQGCLSVIFRLAWIFGTALILFSGLFIAEGKAPGVSDAAFLVITAGVILCRFVDIKFLSGETAENKPADMRTWRRYAVKMLLAAVIIYAIAKAVAGKGLL